MQGDRERQANGQGGLRQDEAQEEAQKINDLRQWLRRSRGVRPIRHVD